MREDHFGSRDQKALLERGAQMHLITQYQPYLTYYGRTVGATSPRDVPLKTLMALARLQGNSSFFDLPDDEAPSLAAEAVAAGLVPVHYRNWAFDINAIDRARSLATGLPSAYRIEWLTPDTPQSLRRALADTALTCRVLPPSLAVLSGTLKPGVCAMALTKDGQVAACAAAASYFNSAHPKARTSFWWGMLATHPEHRGKGLSITLGAATMVRMRDRYSFTDGFTGIEPGNSASEAVCQKLGLSHNGRSILGISDPDLIAGGRMTK